MDLALQLPKGSGLVLRTFGRPEIEAVAPVIAAIAELRALTFLVSADPDLAEAVGAHGVHWPEAQLRRIATQRFKGLNTASAHSPMAARRAQGLADAVFISTAFVSKSPSASPALGVFRLNAYARRSTIPVYGLGGINFKTIKRLSRTQTSGVAAIDALTDRKD